MGIRKSKTRACCLFGNEVSKIIYDYYRDDKAKKNFGIEFISDKQITCMECYVNFQEAMQGIYRKNAVKYPVKQIKKAKSNLICLHNIGKKAEMTNEII